MRPADVTEDDIREWGEAIDPDDKRRSFIPVSDEVFFAQAWLQRKLAAENRPDDARRAVLANGQRVAMELSDEGIWATTQTTYERFLRGDVDTPGPVLGKKLLEDMYGPGPIGAMNFLSDRGIDFKKVLNAIKGPDGRPDLTKFESLFGPTPMEQDAFDKEFLPDES